MASSGGFTGSGLAVAQGEGWAGSKQRDMLTILREVDRQRDQLQDQLDTRCEQLAAATAQNEDFMKKMQQAKIQFTSLQTQFEMANSARNGMEKEIHSLRIQLDESITERERFRQHLQTSEAERQRLTDDLRELVKENQALSTNNAMLSGKLEQTQNDCQRTNAALGQWEKLTASKELERVHILQNCESLANEQATLQHALHENEMTCEGLRTGLQARDQQLQSLAAQLHEAYEANQNLATNMETTHIQYQALTEELNRAKEIISRLYQDQQHLITDKDAQAMLSAMASEKQTRAETEIARLMALTSSLQEQRDALAAQSSAMEGLAGDERKRVQELERLLAQTRGDQCAAQGQLEGVQAEIARRETKITELQAENNSRTRQCAQLMDSNAKLEGQVNALRTELGQASRIKDDTLAQTSRVRGQTRQLEATVAHLQSGSYHRILAGEARWLYDDESIRWCVPVALEESQKEAAALHDELTRARNEHASAIARTQSRCEKRVGDLEAELGAVRQAYTSLAADHAKMRDLYASLIGAPAAARDVPVPQPPIYVPQYTLSATSRPVPPPSHRRINQRQQQHLNDASRLRLCRADAPEDRPTPCEPREPDEMG
ncbi:hypothetical protein PAPYR_1439 [Paratrimastix pyriformis]|uniref:Uncharacterized protein n=1 Tax=Paratrimastix pyriformis TaxID=342808 RepID=A0ABQ8UV34_9EUKA|nr:hypothetical protein PAPYR_1439 [Paratrimastix pyriformis]